MRRPRPLLHLCLTLLLLSVSPICAHAGGDQETPGARRNAAGTAIERLDAARAAPVKDIDGYTIRIAAHWPGPGRHLASGRYTLDLWEQAAQKYDVNFEWIEMPNPDTLIEKMVSTIMIGEPFADLIWVDGSRAIPVLAEANLLLPLDDYVDLADPRWPPQIREACTYRGKTYGVYPWVLAGGAGIWYNRSLFEREGLPDLLELQRRGEWTWDQYLEIARKATRDRDADGAIDQWGITIGYEIEYDLIQSNGAEIVAREPNGEFRFRMDSPAAIEALEFIRTLYTTGVTTHGEEQFISGRAAMYGGQLFQGNHMMTNMRDEYGWVFYPRGPSADGYVSVAGTGAMLAIPANVNYPPDRLGKILKEITPLDHQQEIQMEFWEGAVTSAEDIETIRQQIDSMVYSWTGNFPGLKRSVGEILREIRKGTSPATAVEQYKPQAQAAIDAVFR